VSFRVPWASFYSLRIYFLERVSKTVLIGQECYGLPRCHRQLVVQGMMGGIKANYGYIRAFSETDLEDDLKSITVPVLIQHGDDDQIVPIADSVPLSAELVKKRQGN